MQRAAVGILSGLSRLVPPRPVGRNVVRVEHARCCYSARERVLGDRQYLGLESGDFDDDGWRPVIAAAIAPAKLMEAVVVERTAYSPNMCSNRLGFLALVRMRG